ncbi:hypothetical protein H6228_002779 [Enterococcus faecalis]|uniref:hypothetical protein n=1 Tax=Enterococcus TaxID=1350 RepID=UPI000CF26370|nr:hypothetical protein [Enterococcus faecalis]MDU2110480.1 hypothetical protein [Peptoniphilus lacydonensis]EGO5066839.1 hypothetical protein [Enterococcus faecalis]EGO5077146.1 hypothetical protein [Enterococcus faecalis]EGO5984708.1 hypothetical protein [Enterococcus faecalis]EGO8139423.1 hypothetical protein [Enterococcus faecalis]
MKRYLGILGAYLIVQPSLFTGMLGRIDQNDKDKTAEFRKLSATVEYQNDQVVITKANQRKKDNSTKKTDSMHLNKLENYLMILENEPKLNEGTPSSTQLGQKMKHLSKTFLFTG